jgi:hypothetical protein
VTGGGRELESEDVASERRKECRLRRSLAMLRGHGLTEPEP